MFELKAALDAGDESKVIAITSDVDEIARNARGSKTRIRSATKVFALHESLAGDARVAKWTQQKVAESVMRGLLDIVQEHEEVDRFCNLLGECLLEGLSGMTWYWCVSTLLFMRDPQALNFVLDYAEQSSHGSPGTLNLLARGGEIGHEAERVKQYLRRWESTDKLDYATCNWILAKLGDANAYDALVELCINGSMDRDNAMRAAQALSHLNKWNIPWGIEGTELVRAKISNSNQTR